MTDGKARPGDEELADLAFAIVRVARELRGYGPESGFVQLTMSESALMWFVDRHPGGTVGTAAAATGLLIPNASAALRGLRAKGMVEVRRDPTDGRVSRLHPTELAHDNLARLRQRWGAMLAEALAAAPQGPGADPAACTGLLTRIEDGLLLTRAAGRS